MKLNTFLPSFILAIITTGLLIANRYYLQTGVIFDLIIIILAIGATAFFVSKSFHKISDLIKNLEIKIKDITQTLNELTLESHYLYTSSNAQSDAIQSSASSIEETSSMAEQTAQQSKDSSSLAGEINNFASDGTKIMNELSESIESINVLNTEIQHIQQMFHKVTERTRMIDEIVFNTKLLSFNASIEAERAGQHGAGFAVVAQEIGKLANNSGAAAREIRDILKESNEKVGKIVDDTATKVKQGRVVSEKVISNFDSILQKINDISKKIDSIRDATKEQEIGIKQISKAMSKMDLTAHENVKVAHTTELLSAKSEDQLTELVQTLQSLTAIVEGDNAKPTYQATGNFITWNANLSVGILSIDEQHKKLIDIINKLYKSIVSNEGTARFNEIFSGLLEYTGKHFAYEEEIFEKTGYPKCDEHKHTHAKLVERVLELQKDFKNDNAVIGREIMDFLKNWLTNHIQKSDKEYTAHLKKNGIK